MSPCFFSSNSQRSSSEALAIKAYDSHKKQLNLISDDQFFNGLFCLLLFFSPLRDLHSRFLLFDLTILRKKSERH